MVIDMPKKMKNKRIPESKNKGYSYLVLIGVILLIIGLLVIAFASQQIVAGAVLLLLGVFICVLGLSKHSFHLLKRRAGKV
jgi:uncharacterized membrane protein HdeD (DUF308 family)